IARKRSDRKPDQMGAKRMKTSCSPGTLRWCVRPHGWSDDCYLGGVGKLSSRRSSGYAARLDRTSDYLSIHIFFRSSPQPSATAGNHRRARRQLSPTMHNRTHSRIARPHQRRPAMTPVHPRIDDQRRAASFQCRLPARDRSSLP
ncbi:Unknown protein, partial [Striga hermonthica]